MFEDSEDTRQISYWPSVSDLFMTLFIIALVLFGVLYYVFLPTSTAPSVAVVEAVGGLEMPQILNPTNKMRRAIGTPEIPLASSPVQIVSGLSETANQVVERLEVIKPGSDMESILKQLQEALHAVAERDAEIARLKDRVADMEKGDKPIITITTTGPNGNPAYRFDSGSAVLKGTFKNGLRAVEFAKLANEIIERNKSGRFSVDTLEIIGHTDGKPVSANGNLDRELPGYLSRVQKNVALLSPGSNNDLGLLRALAIKEAWLDYAKDRETLSQIEVRCYSAGQTIPEGMGLGDARLRDPAQFRMECEECRRIEIRLTKLR